MQRGTPSGTATSAAPSSGTSLQPSRRAARAGYSAVRSGDDVKMALSTSSGWKPFACCSPRNSSAVASRIDRKSTRLNSSHGYISYAVFCLKKKKIDPVRRQAATKQIESEHDVELLSAELECHT